MKSYLLWIRTTLINMDWKAVLLRAGLVALFFCLGAALGLVVIFYYFSQTLPEVEPLLKDYDPPQTTRILADDGSVIGEIFTERRTVVSLEEIPQVMIDAVISAEDADFRKHKGLDYKGMIRAMLANLVSGRLAQGASTITQQVARTLFLTREKTFSRKIREILLTKQIEEKLSKDQILHLYLNQINFGHARYGVCEAARYYFDVSTKDITLAQAALLAGIPKGPSVYSPINNPEGAKMRRSYVLGEMQKNGYISEAEALAARDAPLGIAEQHGYDRYLAPEAVSEAIAELGSLVDLEQLKQGGYTIETTLDARVQAEARQALMKGLSEIDKRHRRLAPFKALKKWPEGDRGDRGPLRVGQTYIGEVFGHDDERGIVKVRLGPHEGYVYVGVESRYNPKQLPASSFARIGAKLPVVPVRDHHPGHPAALRLSVGPQGALVALRPQDGSIMALVGGDRVSPGGFDRAIAAVRQPGSVFKPISYLAALQTGRYTAATLIDDAPEVHGEWQPKNADMKEYEGTVRLREAFARSLNLPAVKVIADVGPEEVVGLARKLGVQSDLEPTPSLALGASAVRPLEMAAVYGVFANGGQRIAPWIVSRVLDPGGQEIPLPSREAEQVISPQEAYLITSLLRSVVEEGTGRGALALERPAGGKTGTSNDQRDAWFVGFTSQYVCAVWVGYDDFRPIGNKEYGGRAALPIWVDFMKGAHGKLPIEDFVSPGGLVVLSIDKESGLLAYEGMEGMMNEIFLPGTEPTEQATPPELVDPSGFVMDEYAAEPRGGSAPDAGAATGAAAGDGVGAIPIGQN